MKIKVRFFATLRDLFGSEEKEIELRSGANIQDLLNCLCNSSLRRQQIFDHRGEPMPYIKILKNGRHIELLDRMHTKLEEGDQVVMLRPSGGG